MCASVQNGIWSISLQFGFMFSVTSSGHLSPGDPRLATSNLSSAGGAGGAWGLVGGQGALLQRQLCFVVCDCPECRAAWPNSPGCGRRSLPSWAHAEWARGS